jgi:hypothetical protein
MICFWRVSCAGRFISAGVEEQSVRTGEKDVHVVRYRKRSVDAGVEMLRFEKFSRKRGGTKRLPSIYGIPPHALYTSYSDGHDCKINEFRSFSRGNSLAGTKMDRRSQHAR